MTSLLLMVMVFASFLLGFVRDMTIAWRFGGSWFADALFVCLVVPVFFENLLGIAVRDGVIAYIRGGRSRRQSACMRDEVERLQRYLWGMAAIITALAWIGAEFWLSALAPGWDESRVNGVLFAFRISSLLIFVQTVLYFQTAVLNAGGRFVLPMWRTIALNVGAIFALVIYPASLVAVVFGMLVGQVLLLIVQQHTLGRSVQAGVPAAGDSSKRGLHTYLLPLVIAAVFQQLCVVAEKYFGSLLNDGCIAYLSFGFRVATIPLTVFSLSFLSVIYPALAGRPAGAGWSARGSLEYRSFGICLLMLVPASTVLVAHAAPVVAALFQRGAFGPEQTALTAPLMAAYAAGVPAMGLALLGGRILLARGQGRSFVVAAVAVTVSTLLLDWLLYRRFGSVGLAVAMTVGSWLQALYTLNVVFAGSSSRAVFLLFARWSVAALVGYVLLRAVPAGNSIVSLIVVCMAGLAVHLAVIVLMGDRDWLRRDYWGVGLTSSDHGKAPS